VLLAQKLVPELESMPEAIQGTVNTSKLDNALLNMQHGNMVICRRNAPLISIAYQLIKQGKSVIVRGRDIGKGMQVIISKLKANTIEELIDKAESFRTKELDKLAKKGSRAENQIQALNDRIDTLVALTEGKDTIDDLRRYIQDLFTDADQHNSVMLSSVHRAKGLESMAVFVVDYAKIQLKLKNERLQVQEKHLEYIALTRSKDTLWLVD
jgi:superfamily I DNA/RNA helicase